MREENPFDLLGLAPHLDTRKITEVLRRRAETLSGEEREKLQQAWRDLTMKESARVKHAFFAHPRAADEDHLSISELRNRAVAPIIRLRRTTPQAKPTDSRSSVPHRVRPPLRDIEPT